MDRSLLFLACVLCTLHTMAQSISVRYAMALTDTKVSNDQGEYIEWGTWYPMNDGDGIYAVFKQNASGYHDLMTAWVDMLSPLKDHYDHKNADKDLHMPSYVKDVTDWGDADLAIRSGQGWWKQTDVFLIKDTGRTVMLVLYAKEDGYMLILSEATTD